MPQVGYDGGLEGKDVGSLVEGLITGPMNFVGGAVGLGVLAAVGAMGEIGCQWGWTRWKWWWRWKEWW